MRRTDELHIMCMNLKFDNTYFDEEISETKDVETTTARHIKVYTPACSKDAANNAVDHLNNYLLNLIRLMLAKYHVEITIDTLTSEVESESTITKDGIEENTVQHISLVLEHKLRKNYSPRAKEAADRAFADIIDTLYTDLALDRLYAKVTTDDMYQYRD